ncbi:hypothetical protein [Aliivibrio sifiae]|uniref:hypothetical protein n=1 Tax=Aliivibrio sifiae TaxID=566293 RepID=UPI003D0FB97C
MKFFNKYIEQISYILVGFYISAIFLAMASSENKNLLDIFNSLSGFISAGGALAAILTVITVIKQRQSDIDEKSVNYANYILFILDRQIIFISIVYKVAIKPHENKSNLERAFCMLMGDFDSTLVNAINIEESMFILTNKNPETIRFIDEIQRDTATVADLIARRNQMYESYVKPFIRDKTINDFGENYENIENIVGPQTVYNLIKITDEIVSMLPLLQMELIKVQNELHEFACIRFSDYEILAPTTSA